MQCIKVADTVVPLLFDDLKCYVKLEKPVTSDIKIYPCVELTSPLPYNPTLIYTRRRTNTPTVGDVDQWYTNLGFPTIVVTKRTLKCATRYITFVEAESWEYMRDHLRSRLMCLCPHRINNVCFSDNFYSFIKSVRGFKMFQMLTFHE